MLVCRPVSCAVSGEPTLIMPGELTEMLAGDIATVCSDDIDGGKAETVPSSADITGSL